MDLRWPSSMSPSMSKTSEIQAASLTSPSATSASLSTLSAVSSVLNHSWPHLVTFLFFQCQLAVEGGSGAGTEAMEDRLVMVRKQETITDAFEFPAPSSIFSSLFWKVIGVGGIHATYKSTMYHVAIYLFNYLQMRTCNLGASPNVYDHLDQNAA